MENKKPLVSAQISANGDDVTTWALPKVRLRGWDRGLCRHGIFLGRTLSCHWNKGRTLVA